MSIGKIWDIPAILQPIKMKSALEIWLSNDTPIARQTWVYGPKKPRDQLRTQEIPVDNVGLERLSEDGIVQVRSPLKVESASDVGSIPEDTDVILIGDMEDWMAPDDVLDELAALGKPIMPEWDQWGYSIHGRLSKFRHDRYSKVKYIIPMGSRDVLDTLNAVRAVRAIRNLKVLYIGKYPPRSVAVPKGVTLDYLEDRLGVEVVTVGIDDYMEAVWDIEDGETDEIAERWRKRFEILDRRGEKLNEYAKIYLALKRMLERYDANSLTVECPALPDIDYVPCVAFSMLIDEGIPSGCEADIPALLTMTALMVIGGRAVLMGNLNENVTHWDIERGVVTINHDVVPPSYTCPWCKLKIRDYHGMRKGSTTYADLTQGAPVTLAGIHWNLNKVWATEGTVAWTEDTIHCRECVGVKVKDSKTISKMGFGHHIVLAYGRHEGAMGKLADLLDMEFVDV